MGSGACSPRSPRDQRREAGEINKSLSQLALVIQRLTTKTNYMHVPYRDSMLTRLLAESFGGNSKTCLIITCSSMMKDREETRGSLEFGKRAKLVKNKAEINLEVKAEINLEVTKEVTPVMQAFVQKQLAQLNRDREEHIQEKQLLAQELEGMRKQIAERDLLLEKAADDAVKCQEKHGRDMKQLEDAKDM